MTDEGECVLSQLQRVCHIPATARRGRQKLKMEFDVKRFAHE